MDKISPEIFKGKKALVVDDEQDLREIIAEMLSGWGFEAAVADSGNAALVLCKHERFDLVVSDVRMPNGDGVHLLHQLKEGSIVQRLQFIFVTGHSELTFETAKEMGARSLINKPFTYHEFFDLLCGLFAAGGAQSASS